MKLIAIFMISVLIFADFGFAVEIEDGGATTDTTASAIQETISSEQVQQFITSTSAAGSACPVPLSDYKCTSTILKGIRFTCPQEGYTPLMTCGSNPYLQCCIPVADRESKCQSGEYKKCSWPLQSYDCKTTAECESSGGISYPGFCPGATDVQCCVPKQYHVATTYVFDKADVLSDETEAQINAVLESIDNKNKFEIDGQVRMKVIIQTENSTITNLDDFVKKRYAELMVEKIYPSALILFYVGNGVKIVKWYPATGSLSRELYFITQEGENKKLLDTGEYNDAMLRIANNISEYALSYSRIAAAIREFSVTEGCTNFGELMKKTAVELDVPENVKTQIAAEITEDSGEVCARAWKKAATSELSNEIKHLQKAIEKTRSESTFGITTPSCDVSLNGKYACVEVSSTNTFEIRRCDSVRNYANSTTTGISVGDSCASAGPGPDDYFDSSISAFLGLSGGQVRCAKDGNSYALVQCSGQWTAGSVPLIYDTQDDCAVACNNMDNIRNYCTEPRIYSRAFSMDSGQIQDGATVPWADYRLSSINDNQNSAKLDRDIYHNIKYRVFRDGQLWLDDQISCPAGECDAFLDTGKTAPGAEIQYWSEIGFQETNGKSTYIRSPVWGVHSFKISGSTPPALTTAVSTPEVFAQWKVVSETQKFSSYQECQNTCRYDSTYSANCLQQPDVPLEEGTNNFIKNLRGSINAAGLEREKTAIQQLSDCLSKSSFTQCFDAVNAENDNILSVNARALMLKNIDNNMASYLTSPSKTVCDAAWAASASLDAPTCQPRIVATGGLSVPTSTVDCSIDTDVQYRINGYSLVIEKCSIDDPVARANAGVASNNIKSINAPFSTGVMNVIESFAEPASLKVLAGMVVLSFASSFIPATSIAAAARVSAAVKIVQTALESYFIFEMGMGLRESIPKCYAAGFNSAECGEAVTQTVLLGTLMFSSSKNIKLADKSLKSAARMDVLEAEIRRLDTELTEASTDLDAAIKANPESPEIAKLSEEVAKKRELVEKAKSDPRFLKLLSEMLESGDVEVHLRAPRLKAMLEEYKELIKEKEVGRQTFICTGGITGAMTCPTGKTPDPAEVVERVSADIKKSESGARVFPKDIHEARRARIIQAIDDMQSAGDTPSLDIIRYATDDMVSSPEKVADIIKSAKDVSGGDTAIMIILDKLEKDLAADNQILEKSVSPATGRTADLVIDAAEGPIFKIPTADELEARFTNSGKTAQPRVLAELVHSGLEKFTGPENAPVLESVIREAWETKREYSLSGEIGEMPADARFKIDYLGSGSENEAFLATSVADPSFRFVITVNKPAGVSSLGGLADFNTLKTLGDRGTMPKILQESPTEVTIGGQRFIVYAKEYVPGKTYGETTWYMLDRTGLDIKEFGGRVIFDSPDTLSHLETIKTDFPDWVVDGTRMGDIDVATLPPETAAKIKRQFVSDVMEAQGEAAGTWYVRNNQLIGSDAMSSEIVVLIPYDINSGNIKIYVVSGGKLKAKYIDALHPKAADMSQMVFDWGNPNSKAVFKTYGNFVEFMKNMMGYIEPTTDFLSYYPSRPGFIGGNLEYAGNMLHLLRGMKDKLGSPTERTINMNALRRFYDERSRIYKNYAEGRSVDMTDPAVRSALGDIEYLGGQAHAKVRADTYERYVREIESFMTTEGIEIIDTDIVLEPA